MCVCVWSWNNCPKCLRVGTTTPGRSSLTATTATDPARPIVHSVLTTRRSRQFSRALGTGRSRTRTPEPVRVALGPCSGRARVAVVRARPAAGRVRHRTGTGLSRQDGKKMLPPGPGPLVAIRTFRTFDRSARACVCCWIEASFVARSCPCAHHKAPRRGVAAARGGCNFPATASQPGFLRGSERSALGSRDKHLNLEILPP